VTYSTFIKLCELLYQLIGCGCILSSCLSGHKQCREKQARNRQQTHGEGEYRRQQTLSAVASRYIKYKAAVERVMPHALGYHVEDEA
jgi:hypothetical protein